STRSRRNVRAAPAVSCSSAMKYRCGTGEGSEAMLCRRSVRLNGTWQVSQEEVPTYRCAWKSRVAPAPIAADWRSGEPTTTGMPAGTPSAGGPGQQRAEDVRGGQQFRQPRLLDPGQPQQRL